MSLALIISGDGASSLHTYHSLRRRLNWSSTTAMSGSQNSIGLIAVLAIAVFCLVVGFGAAILAISLDPDCPSCEAGILTPTPTPFPTIRPQPTPYTPAPTLAGRNQSVLAPAPTEDDRYSISFRFFGSVDTDIRLYEYTNDLSPMATIRFRDVFNQQETEKIVAAVGLTLEVKASGYAQIIVRLHRPDGAPPHDTVFRHELRGSNSYFFRTVEWVLEEPGTWEEGYYWIQVIVKNDTVGGRGFRVISVQDPSEPLPGQ